jgi:hypothetical protein
MLALWYFTDDVANYTDRQLAKHTYLHDACNFASGI